MDRKNKGLKNPEKLFYKFLVENGYLFDVLNILQKTRYKTLKEHCKVNRPCKYVMMLWFFGMNKTSEFEKYISNQNSLNENWIKVLQDETIRNQKEVRKSKKAAK